MRTIKQLLITVAVLLCSATANAHDFEVDGIYYDIISASDLTAEVTYKGDSFDDFSAEYSGEVIIPETVVYKSKVLKVTRIGSSAFRDCSALTSIVIGNNVTSIGNYAFEGSSGLTSFEIPNGVTSIGYSTFDGCSSLTSIEIPNSVTSIGDYAFRDCSGLTSVTIPNSVTSIGDSAFRDCSGLTSVTIPNSVTSIGRSAFYGCTGLTSIEIPNSVTSIGDYAFYGCSGLTSITIGKSVTNIGSYAFEGCKSIKNIELNCGYVKNWFRGNESIERVIFGNNVTIIQNDAFQGCTTLERIIIGHNVQSLGNKTFYGCYNLKTVINCSTTLYINTLIIREGNYYINFSKIISVPKGFVDDDFIFNSENTLVAYVGNDTELTLPQSCNGENYIIGDTIFRNNKNLISVTIPNNVTGIEDNAFFGCSELREVHISDLKAWCNIDFGNHWANPFCHADNLYINGELVTELVIPNDITEIKKYAFSGNNTLTSIVIGNNVTSIGGFTFSGCTGLTSIEIPNSITSIEGRAFEACNNLREVHISDLKAWCNIDFRGYEANPFCRAGNLYINGELVTELVIPNDITEIKQYAFKNCSTLTCFVIPNNVTSIGYYAFQGCTGVTSIYLFSDIPPTVRNYNFTESQYANITLYVPTGTLKTYQTADTWKNFWDIQEFDATAIENIEEVTPAFEITSSGIQFTAADSKTVAIYTVAGALIEKVNSYAGETIALDKGVYIIQIGEETTKVKL